MFIFKYFRIYLILINILITYPFVAYSDVKFNSFINKISIESQKKGISDKVIKEFKKNARFIPRVIDLDRSQPEFKLTLDQYLKRVVTPLRIKKANKKYKKNKILLNKIANHYGVQARFLVALWGIETDFGRLTGGFSVVSALASLAYDGRRHDYFKKELFNALKIINDGHISLNKMTGSWAGAMGQCQFMPSSFLNYASDWDKDGTKNIWTSKPDVFASAANYLSKIGWSNKKTWGRKVFVGNNKLKSNKKYHSLKKWSLKKVLNSDKSILPQLNLKARLVIPDNYGNYGFLVYSNFDSLLNWNRSNYFAIAVGKLSDSISEK
jgi:membrane-bound lytic murein transglycosylase B